MAGGESGKRKNWLAKATGGKKKRREGGPTEAGSCSKESEWKERCPRQVLVCPTTEGLLQRGEP